MTNFSSLETATKRDWEEIDRPEHAIAEKNFVVKQLVRLLRDQLNAPSFAWPLNAAQHCLQTATRAYLASESDEVVFAALFHDATEILSPDNHAQSAAALIRPFVSEQTAWMVEHHGVFQNFHCKHNDARFTEARTKWRGHPAYELTERFCRDYDQNSFDRGFQARELEFFAPLIKRMVVGD